MRSLMAKAPQYLMAIDQGTTGTTVLIFDQGARVVGRGYAEFTQYYPQPGWVEHDAVEIWDGTRKVVQQALADGGCRYADIAAIGITNQRETSVLWDRASGQPLGRAIVWQDRRTAAVCDALKQAGHQETIREKTGLVIDPYFSGTKLAWLLEHLPDARNRAIAGDLAFGTIDSWLLWNLTGGACHITDYSNASRTMLYNIHALAWDDEILKLLDIPVAVLPEVRPSSSVYGRTEPGLFDGAAIPVAGMAGDQQAALFGQACYEPGLAKNTYGTGSFILMNTGASVIRSRENLLTTIAWGLEGEPVQYALEGSVFVSGAAVQWLRDGLGIIASAAETEELARSVDSTDDVFFVPALVGLGAPHWDPYARGAIVGLTRGTTRAHLVRATLESIAYQSRDVMQAMERDAGVALQELRADGGAAVNEFLMQFQADILGVAVEVPVVHETTAMGAAYLAGLAVGMWQNVDEIEAQWACARRYEPLMSAEDRERRYARWQDAVNRSRGWAQS